MLPLWQENRIVAAQRRNALRPDKLQPESSGPGRNRRLGRLPSGENTPTTARCVGAKAPEPDRLGGKKQKKAPPAQEKKSGGKASEAPEPKPPAPREARPQKGPKCEGKGKERASSPQANEEPLLTKKQRALAQRGLEVCEERTTQTARGKPKVEAAIDVEVEDLPSHMTEAWLSPDGYTNWLPSPEDLAFITGAESTTPAPKKKAKAKPAVCAPAKAGGETPPPKAKKKALVVERVEEVEAGHQLATLPYSAPCTSVVPCNRRSAASCTQSQEWVFQLLRQALPHISHCLESSDRPLPRAFGSMPWTARPRKLPSAFLVELCSICTRPTESGMDKCYRCKVATAKRRDPPVLMIEAPPVPQSAKLTPPPTVLNTEVQLLQRSEKSAQLPPLQQNGLRTDTGVAPAGVGQWALALASAYTSAPKDAVQDCQNLSDKAQQKLKETLLPVEGHADDGFNVRDTVGKKLPKGQKWAPLEDTGNGPVEKLCASSDVKGLDMPTAVRDAFNPPPLSRITGAAPPASSSADVSPSVRKCKEAKVKGPSPAKMVASAGETRTATPVLGITVEEQVAPPRLSRKEKKAQLRAATLAREEDLHALDAGRDWEGQYFDMPYWEEDVPVQHVQRPDPSSKGQEAPRQPKGGKGGGKADGGGKGKGKGKGGCSVEEVGSPEPPRPSQREVDLAAEKSWCQANEQLLVRYKPSAVARPANPPVALIDQECPEQIKEHMLRLGYECLPVEPIQARDPCFLEALSAVVCELERGHPGHLKNVVTGLDPRLQVDCSNVAGTLAALMYRMRCAPPHVPWLAPTVAEATTLVGMVTHQQARVIAVTELGSLQDSPFVLVTFTRDQLLPYGISYPRGRGHVVSFKKTIADRRLHSYITAAFPPIPYEQYSSTFWRILGEDSARQVQFAKEACISFCTCPLDHPGSCAHEIAWACVRKGRLVRNFLCDVGVAVPDRFDNLLSDIRTSFAAALDRWFPTGRGATAVHPRGARFITLLDGLSIVPNDWSAMWYFLAGCPGPSVYRLLSQQEIETLVSSTVDDRLHDVQILQPVGGLGVRWTTDTLVYLSGPCDQSPVMIELASTVLPSHNRVLTSRETHQKKGSDGITRYLDMRVKEYRYTSPAGVAQDYQVYVPTVRAAVSRQMTLPTVQVAMAYGVFKDRHIDHALEGYCNGEYFISQPPSQALVVDLASVLMRASDKELADPSSQAFQTAHARLLFLMDAEDEGHNPRDLGLMKEVPRLWSEVSRPAWMGRVIAAALAMVRDTRVQTAVAITATEPPKVEFKRGRRAAVATVPSHQSEAGICGDAFSVQQLQAVPVGQLPGPPATVNPSLPRLGGRRGTKKPKAKGAAVAYSGPDAPPEAKRCYGNCGRYRPVDWPYKWPDGVCPECCESWEVKPTCIREARAYLGQSTPSSSPLPLGPKFVIGPSSNWVVPLAYKVKPIKATLLKAKWTLKPPVYEDKNDRPEKYLRAGHVLPRAVGFVHKFTPTWHCNSTSTAKVAIQTRILAETKAHAEPGSWAKVWKFVWKHRDLLMPWSGPRSEAIHKLSWESWVAAFPPARKVVLEKERLSLLERGIIDDVGKLLRPSALDKQVRYKLFVKKELGPGTCPADDVRNDDGMFGVETRLFDKPRAIQSPNECCHVILGPWLRAATKVFKNQHPVWFNTTYAGGLTPVDLDNWINTRPSADTWIMCDFSQFDGSIGPDALKFVRSWLKAHGFPRHELLKFWQKWAIARGRAAGGMKYRGGEMNCSGRDDTALINALLNWASQTTAWIAEFCGVGINGLSRLTPEQVGKAHSGINLICLGDDSLASVPHLPSSTSLRRVESYIAGLGFSCKIAVAQEKDEVVFLGSRPYWAIVNGTETLSWGPTLGRRLYKHHWMLQPTKAVLRWLAGIVDFEHMAYSHIPYLGELADAAHEVTKFVTCRLTPEALVKSGAMNRFRDLPIYDDRAHRVITRSEKIYEQLHRVYGVGSADLQTLVDQLATWRVAGRPFPYQLNSWAVERMIRQDDK